VARRRPLDEEGFDSRAHARYLSAAHYASQPLGGLVGGWRLPRPHPLAKCHSPSAAPPPVPPHRARSAAGCPQLRRNRYQIVIEPGRRRPSTACGRRCGSRNAASTAACGTRVVLVATRVGIHTHTRGPAGLNTLGSSSHARRARVYARCLRPSRAMGQGEGGGVPRGSRDPTPYAICALITRERSP
jgi:hypothetical protein